MGTKITPTVIFTFLLIAVFSCRETPTDTNGRGENLLIVEDVGVTDAVLRIKKPVGNLPTEVILKRERVGIEGSTIIVLNKMVVNSDTVVIDERLFPKVTYQYTMRVEMGTNSQMVGGATITTMDTTSHDFRWQIDTLGDGIGSILYDVAIVNDTCVYAVGEIYKRDSTGQFNTTPYNFLRWNGKKWEMRSITNVAVRAIFVFSENDIWAGTSGPYHWDGVSWKTFKLNGAFNGYVNKFWGTSSNNLYMVGTSGSIAHFDGSTWRRLESGTDRTIQDIYGIVDEKTGKQFVYCAASNPLEYGEKKILSIREDNTIESIPWTYNNVVMSIWMNSPKRLYACGEGIYRRYCNQVWKFLTGSVVINVFTSKIRGIADNDMFVVGDFGVLGHYNGMSFKLYPEAKCIDIYKSVDYKNGHMAAVGLSKSYKVFVFQMWKRNR